MEPCHSNASFIPAVSLGFSSLFPSSVTLHLSNRPSPPYKRGRSGPLRRARPSATVSDPVGDGSVAGEKSRPAVSEPTKEPTTCWELDFYSRPVLGDNRRKIWELILVDSEGVFQHVERIPSSKVNSKELKRRVKRVIDDVLPERRPTAIRYFRSEMMNMIRIALSGVDIAVKPSRRTYALFAVLKHRERTVYPSMKGYDKSLASSGMLQRGGLPFSPTTRMPDAMRGESFMFNDYPLWAIQSFFESADPDDFFGSMCPVDDEISKQCRIPGLFILSKRAKAIAAWTNGAEVAYIKGLLEKREVVIECELTTRYLLAKITKELRDDVKKFEDGERQASGLHFLAIQESKESEEIEGFWLLRDIEIP